MLNFLAGLWQFLWVWAVGIPLERRLKWSLPYGYRLAVAFGLGEMVVSFLLFFLGLVGGLRFWVLFPSALLISLWLFPELFREAKPLVREIQNAIRQSRVASGMVAVLLLFYTLGACVPEREVDSLWYHLGVPLYYLMHGGAIQFIPFNMCSHYPMSFHLHYAFSLLVGNDTTAKVFILCHLIPFLIFLASVVKKYGGSDWRMFAVLVYLCNLQIRLPIMANVESGVYFYVFLSTVLLWHSLESGNRSLFLTASLFCGMAMGTKLSGLLFGYAAQWLLLGTWILFLGNDGWGVGIKKWVVHTLLSWMMMLPWMIKSCFYTWNPLYPMLGEFFPTKPEFVRAMVSNARNHGINFLKAHNWNELIGEIVKNIEWHLYNAELIFFLGFSSILILFFTHARRLALPLASGTIAYLLFTSQWGSDIARLFAANDGVLVLLITLAISSITERIPAGRKRGGFQNRPYFLYWLVALGMFVTFFEQRLLYLGSPNIQWFGGVYLSEPARREWLASRHIFSGDMFKMRDWMQNNISGEDELYGYRVGYPFYLHRKYIICDAHFGEQLDRWLARGPDYAAEQLSSLQVKWFLVDWGRTSMDNSPVYSEWQEFYKQYLEENHREGTVVLYRFKFKNK